MLYVDFPESGYVREIDDRRFPRPLFWDRFAAYTHSPALESADIAAIRALRCPDGTHLDYHDKARFTEALVDALHIKRAPSGPGT